MTKYSPHSKFLASICVVSVFAGGLAQAQDGPSDTEARLSTVTVTAQRIEENLQDVPISITAISDEKLNTLKAGGADVRFLSARAPSVIAESSFGRAFPRFYIRGIGNTDFDLNASQPVSLVYDQVPYENPILKGYPVFDLSSVEVLRGPQGTLFGRNTPGGIIKFDSVKPGDDRDAYARVSYGSYNTIDLEGAAGVRVNDALAVRLSGISQTRDDYVDNTFTGEADALEGYDEWAVRGQALLTPFDNDFSALLNLHARRNESSARLFRANIIDAGSNGIGSNFDRDRVSFDGLNDLKQEAWGVTLTVDKSLTDDVDFTYVFGRETADVASRGDIDGGFGAAFLGDGNFGPGFIPFPSESGGSVDDLVQITHEARIAHNGGGPLSWQAGLFYFDEDIQITSRSFNTLAPDNPENGRAVRNGQTESFSVFASASYDATEQLTISGGARFTDEETDFQVTRLTSPFGAGGLGPVTGAVSDEQISWDVSATYAVNDDVNLYGKVAKGFRGPSVQGRLVFGNTVSDADSETVLSYEVGAKSELLDDRMRLNAAAFFYQLDDQQLTIVGGLDNTVALFNADESEGYGFEFDVEAAPTPNLQLTAGLSYNKTAFKDDVLIAPGCGGGCTMLDPEVFDDAGNSLGFNISDNSFPNAPEWIGNITARYAYPIAGGELYGYTDWAYKGDTNFFLYESAEFGQDGYWEGGLRLGYKSDRGYDVSIFGRNILDEEALTGGIDFNNLTGFVNEPRIIGIELNWELQ
jgi:iron complex outermembrane receptor protein